MAIAAKKNDGEKAIGDKFNRSGMRELHDLLFGKRKYSKMLPWFAI